mmetsp:Transcript_102726/g.199112  ORF Transcript_102726/g.199112 Transcript_102726/m.199112 type:complete len:436 (-) Transcript_102726:78-1385(-)
MTVMDDKLGMHDWMQVWFSIQKETVEKRLLWRIVRSMPFHVSMSVVILFHALSIGLTTDAELSAVMAKEEPDKMWAIMDICFSAVFTLELILRILAERLLFFFGEERMWNLFDTVLVILSIIDTVLNNMSYDGTGDLAAARMVRFVRFVRLVRLARAVRAIHSLRLFIHSIIASGISLIWCLVIISFVMYFFVSVFLNGITEHVRSNPDDPSTAALAEYYGSVWKAMVTLFMSISGGVDWKDAMEPLLHVHWLYEMTFVFFIYFMFFGVLNIVVSAFVQAAAEIAKKDREFLVHQELESSEAYNKKIRAFFAEADKDQSGMLSWEEFEDHLKNPKVSAYFASLELDVTHAHRLFKLLDVNRSNEVGLDEFLDGCVRLKGEAKSIDVNMLVYEMDNLSQQITKMAQAAVSLATTSPNRSGTSLLKQSKALARQGSP